MIYNVEPQWVVYKFVPDKQIYWFKISFKSNALTLVICIFFSPQIQHNFQLIIDSDA